MCTHKCRLYLYYDSRTIMDFTGENKGTSAYSAVKSAGVSRGLVEEKAPVTMSPLKQRSFLLISLLACYSYLFLCYSHYPIPCLNSLE